MKLEINVNDMVSVDLTQKGYEVLLEYYKKYSPPGSDNTQYIEMYVKQPDGQYKFHLWNLMQIFGEKMHMGGEQMFTKNILTLYND